MNGFCGWFHSARWFGCCAVIVADQLRDYLEHGNVTNAVNFPAVSMARESAWRVAIANAIRLAARGVEHQVVTRLEEQLPPGVLASARSTTPMAEK